jgi:hypothetical protein
LIKGWRGSCERKREGLSDEESVFAVRGGFQIPASELMEEVLPGSGEDFFFWMTFLLRFLQVHPVLQNPLLFILIWI